MTTRVVSVRPDAPVSRAVDLLRRYGFSALPVADAAYHLVGMISLLDVIRLRESDPDAGDVPIHTIMNPDVLSFPPTARTTLVAHRMRAYGELRVMPIVQGRVLVGIVTRSDLLRPPKRSGVLDRVRGRRVDADERLLGLARPGRGGPPAPGDAPVATVMTTDVVTVRRTDAISTATELLVRHRHTALPVVEADGRLIGLVSEADALGDPLYAQTRRGTVDAVMTVEPITIDAGATVGNARSLVAESGLRLLPVVAEAALVGVVARSDLV